MKIVDRSWSDEAGAKSSITPVISLSKAQPIAKVITFCSSFQFPLIEDILLIKQWK